ncbi:hypothetical protein SUGI_1112800 [Cryptomeria japonica]|nr:hypothetical protein SUGI_1112800 [Cryptomeria japonica]
MKSVLRNPYGYIQILSSKVVCLQEKFLEQFLEDSLEYVPEENKTILGYKQLSLVVANQKRYEFLADFVPQKIRAAEALSQKASAEN